MPGYTVIISLPESSSGEEVKFARDLGEKLAVRGVSVLTTPDVYHLAPGDAALKELHSLDTPLVVLSGHYPRAAFWTLNAMGIKGIRADALKCGNGRSIVCYRLSDKCCPDRWVETLEELVGGYPGGPVAAAEIPGEARERWYPVLDYERCVDCGACLEFCLFGVYERIGNRITASDPDKCKPGCPACARVCPEQAIMFPLHGQDSAIAGADNASIRAFDPDAIARIREDYVSGKPGIADIVSACGCTCDLPAEKAGETGGCTCGKDGSRSCCPQDDREYFDGVIDGLGEK